MGFEPVLFVRPPLRLAWIELRARIGLCRFPAGSPASQPSGGEKLGLPRWVGRAIGLDVHRDFCLVAICEDGKCRSAGRVASTPEGINARAESLLPSDRVALEVACSCREVARILEPHVQRVVVVSPDDTGITSPRAKTDKLDARTLASLLWKVSLRRCGCPMSAAGSCAAGWLAASNWSARARQPRTRSTPRCSAGCRPSRHALICSESRAASGSQPGAGAGGARVGRRGDPPHRVFGQRDRRGEAADSPAGAELAGDPAGWTVPGVNLSGAASFIAAVGSANRFMTSGKLVAYLGLDRASSTLVRRPPAAAGSPSAGRRPLGGRLWRRVERGVATRPVARVLSARPRAARSGNAIVATARKLAILFWCMLTRSEDYAHQQPSLTRKNMRRLEITAGAPKNTPRSADWSTNELMRTAERELAEQPRPPTSA